MKTSTMTDPQRRTVKMQFAEKVKSQDNDSNCPRCKYRGNVVPLLLDQAITIPVSVKWIFRFTIGLDMAVKYCPTCGYFMVDASQENIGRLLHLETPVEA